MKPLFAAAEFTSFGPNRLNPTDDADEIIQVAGTTTARLLKGVRAWCPQRPGVYGLRDHRGDLIYVGKAKRLRTRLLSYFRATKPRDKARRLLARAKEIVWEYAHDEFAALLRELDLIRRWRPRYNVVGHPDAARRRWFVCVGRAPAPYVFLATQPSSRCQAVFGPVPAGPQVRLAVRWLNDHFQLRDCPQAQTMRFAEQGELFPAPPSAGCLRYDLGTCLGPCARACTRQGYHRQVQGALAWLRHDGPEPRERLVTAMRSAALTKDYEQAAAWRDKVAALDRLRQSLNRVTAAQRDLTFIYPVRGHGGVEHWYYLAHGQVRAVTAAPRESAEWDHCRTLAQALVHAPNQVGGPLLPAAGIDHAWLVAAWFRKYPQERAKAFPATQVCDRVSPLRRVV